MWLTRRLRALARAVHSTERVVSELETAESDVVIPYSRREDGSIDVDASVEAMREYYMAAFEEAEFRRVLSPRRRRKLVENILRTHRQMLNEEIARGDLS